jgi:hypothetical protein
MDDDDDQLMFLQVRLKLKSVGTVGTGPGFPNPNAKSNLYGRYNPGQVFCDASPFISLL